MTTNSSLATKDLSQRLADKKNYWSSSRELSPCSDWTSPRTYSMPLYGKLLLKNRPRSQSTRHKPDAVAEANRGALLSPEPLFQTTRVTEISGDHAPVTRKSSSSGASFFRSLRELLFIRVTFLSWISCDNCGFVSNPMHSHHMNKTEKLLIPT